MNLSKQEKQVLQAMQKPGAELLFNIKGMVEVRYEKDSFKFFDIGYSLIESLKKKGLIQAKRTHEQANVLQGELYVLSNSGREEASK